MDWREVFPGNRGVDRNGLYDLFDAPVGIKLRVEPSLPSEPLLSAGEVPWEDGVNMQPTATWRDDEGTYGIIYGAKDNMVCYASSKDGYHFVRPSLAQVEWEGFLENNLLADGPVSGIMEDPQAPPEERFKALGQEGGYFDPATDTYFDYVRVHGQEPLEPKGIGTGVPELAIGRRTIGLMRTKDFFAWTPPKLVIYPTPQDDPDTSFYGANYSRYLGRTDLHCLFLQVYHQNSDQIDDQIAFSRDGLIWYRHHEPIIPRGPVGSGYEGMCRTYSGGLIELPDGYWAVSHECNPGLHNRGGFSFFPETAEKLAPGQMDAISGESLTPAQMRWARWLPHRLCGIETELEGRFTTQTIPCTQKELRLNYRCQSGGYLIVELVRLVPGRVRCRPGPAITDSPLECHRTSTRSEGHED